MDHGTPVYECRQDNGETVKKALRRNSRLDKGTDVYKRQGMPCARASRRSTRRRSRKPEIPCERLADHGEGILPVQVVMNT